MEDPEVLKYPRSQKIQTSRKNQEELESKTFQDLVEDTRATCWAPKWAD